MQGRSTWQFLALCIALTTSVPSGAEDTVQSGLYDVGGHRLHLHCEGWGSPTIVFENGLAGLSLEWRPLQRELARFTRTCVYDRAGYGMSDAGPMPRTVERITSDLHHLLVAAEVPAPYLFVAHSFGGYTAQLYARRHPANVDGVVLVDASHPAQHAVFPLQLGHTCEAVAQRRTYGWVVNPKLARNYPAEFTDTARNYMRQNKMIEATVSEMCEFARGGEMLQAAGPFPAKRLLVITRGQQPFPVTPRGNYLETKWQQFQEDLASSVPGAAHVIALHSGHHVHFDQPGLITQLVSNSVMLSRMERDYGETRSAWALQGIVGEAGDGRPVVEVLDVIRPVLFNANAVPH